MNSIIISRQNPKVALFRNLLQSKKARDGAGLFVAEGEKLFFEAVNSALSPKEILITEKFSKNNSKFHEFAINLCNIDIISDDLAHYISDTKTPQGVFFTLALLDKSVNMTTIYNSGSRIVALDNVQDPGNVGAIIRNCDAFGVDAVLLGDTCADIHAPKVVRSAMGSAFRLPIHRADLPEQLLQLKQHGFAIIGAALSEAAKDLASFKFPQKSAVIIGSEGAGISGGVAEICDEKIYIPVKNVESLNAAVAAGIILFVMEERR
ncbi:MAG: RNA methyltransferase [Oscillospiraceae bacterium]|nr:RNA methyltransferase [Oscillospiraceae bacterium]